MITTLLKIDIKSKDIAERNQNILGSCIKLLRTIRYLAMEIMTATIITRIPIFTRMGFCRYSTLNQLSKENKMKACIGMKKIKKPIIDRVFPYSTRENLK